MADTTNSKATWWYAVGAAALILFGFTLAPNAQLTSVPKITWFIRFCFAISFISSMAMLYFWTHKPALNRRLGLFLSWTLAAVPFAGGFLLLCYAVLMRAAEMKVWEFPLMLKPATLNAAGLLFSICGTFMLLWGVMRQSAAALRHLSSVAGGASSDGERENQPWYKRFWIALAMRLGSSDARDADQQPLMDAFPTMAWGITVLIIGFVLQFVAAFL